MVRNIKPRYDPPWRGFLFYDEWLVMAVHEDGFRLEPTPSEVGSYRSGPVIRRSAAFRHT
ncbi:MAG: hypothetical protein GY792_22790 [Gammaproteobacteria bacterium]|nr:hypothetical protein [Gammaproteobacteria bacterium]